MKIPTIKNAVKGLVFGSVCLPLAGVFAEDLNPDTTQWDGVVPEEGATISSGEHEFSTGLTIGKRDTSQPLVITGGKVTVSSGNVLVAGNDNNYSVWGELVVGGTGVFEANGDNTTLWLPNDQRGTGTLTIKDSGRVTVRQISSLFDYRTGYLNLLDSGSLTITGDGSQFSSDHDSVFDFTMGGSASLKSGKIVFGNNNDAVVHAAFNGGTIDATGKEWSVKSGPGSSFVFNGATATIGQLTLEGKTQADFTNTVEIAGGTVTANNLALRGPDGRNVMLLVSGGTFNLPCKPQICDAEGSGEVIFRQTGGTVVVDNETDLNPKPGTHATLELLGGVYRGRHIRGLTGSPWAGGTGSTTVRANGGTLAPSTAYQNGNNILIYRVPEVRLGEQGLTVDSEGHNPATCAKFVNDGEGVAGKFVKTGAGTLTVNLTESETGVGVYEKGRSLNSDHAITVVQGGTLLLANQPAAEGSCRFGRAVSVINGATLSLEGAATKLTVDSLTLGNGQGSSYSTLKLDAGDVVEVESTITANNGAIDAPWITGNGEYVIFTCKGVVAKAQLNNIMPLTVPAGKDYAWVTETDAETGVTTCTLKIDDEGTLTPTASLVYKDGVGERTGDESYSIGTISGNGTTADEIELARRATVTVVEGETLTLSGALTGDRTTLTKTGLGELVLSGDNEGMTGSFVADGGILTIKDKAALGPVAQLAKTLTLKADTLRFQEGNTTGVDPLVLKIDTAADKTPAIVDVASEATLTATDVQHIQGALIKKGAGELALDLGAGDFTLLKNNGNEDNGNAVTLPANGTSPSDTSTLSALTVLEGTLSVKGAGKDQTTVLAKDPMLIGANYVGAAPAVLKLEDVTFGSDGKHVTFGHKNPSGAFGSELRMKNARFNTNKFEVGRDGSGDAQTFTVDLENSYLYDDWKIQFCWGNAVANITANNSTIECSGDTGVIFGGLAGATFTGPQAALAATSANGTGGAGTVHVYNQPYCTGTVKFEQGARLVVTRGILVEKKENGVMPFVFDNGIFEVRSSTKENNCRSKMAQPQNQGFTVEKGGLTVDIAEGVNHYITFPIRGTGAVTKTGAGALYLTESTDDKDVASTEKLLQHTGVTTVSEGTLVVDGGVVAEAKFAVAAGAKLDLNGSAVRIAELSGAGTVANGTVTLKKLVYGETVPTFAEDVTFAAGQKIVVDFGRTDANPLDKHTAAAGLVIGHYAGTAPEGVRFGCENTGIKNAKIEVRFANGDIIGAVKPTGLCILVR